MGRFIKLLLIVLIAVPVMASVNKKKADGGDDLFPWPWGTECPFPWQEIRGIYVVSSQQKHDKYNGHYMLFEVDNEDESGAKLLHIAQYDANGQLYAYGDGFSEENKRVVTGFLNGDPKVKNHENFVVMVRSYAKNNAVSCSGNDLVTAITFCPLRGKKCLKDANYVLIKVKHK